MENRLNLRDYGYTIISRFEDILRRYCYNKIISIYSNINDVIPKGVLKSAFSKCGKTDDIEEILENIEFIQLKEIITFNGHYDIFFDKRKLAMKDFISLMESLYDIRCKIAHIRDNFTSLELTALIDESNKIANHMNRYGEEYIKFVNLLQEKPEELIKRIPINFINNYEKQYNILNNLPIADYEYEGGFVGRKDDKEKIIKMIKDGNHRVITISGAGGVGKSALALNIVNQILAENSVKFDSVIWISAKESKLTYLGIEDVEPTLKDYDELLNTILNVMGFESEINLDSVEKEKNINLLFDMCERVLIVIDNLETITDERIINFILDSHKNTTILITSRKGLGQVERRVELKELKEKEAIRLFRLIAEEKNLKTLRGLDDNLIKKYVNKVYRYPLAIKWVLGQVAIGKDINAIIDGINESSSDISKFCFEQIYQNLTSQSKLILCALSFFDKGVTKGILKYISNLNEGEFEDSVRDLVLVSLIIPDQSINYENNEIKTLFSLLPLTRGYVKVQLDLNSDLKRIIQDRILTVENTVEEANRAKKQYRFSLSNLGANTEEEKVAAMIAQTAYQKYQSGVYLDALSDFKKAVNIAPRFASIYRNWAIVEASEGHYVEADKLMSKAAQLSPNDTQIWLVWGNIKRKNDRIKDAYQYYNRAYELSPNDNVVLNTLGQTLSRMGEYDKANDLLIKALNVGEQSLQIKDMIINKTCIAENLKRWSESLVKDRDYKQAEEKLLIALKNMRDVLKLDGSDVRSCIMLRELLIEIGFLYKKDNRNNEAIKYFNEAVEMPAKKYKEYEMFLRASIEIAKIYIKVGKLELASELTGKEQDRVSKFIGNKKLVEEYEKICSILKHNNDRINGKIITWNINRKFGIIENENSPGETFLAHISDFNTFVNPLEMEMKNLNVSFIPVREIEDKKVAKSIIVK